MTYFYHVTLIYISPVTYFCPLTLAWQEICGNAYLLVPMALCEKGGAFELCHFNSILNFTNKE